VFENSRFRRAAAARATGSERRDWMGTVADWGERTYQESENRSIAGQVLLPLVARSLKVSERPGKSRMMYEWAGWLLFRNNRLEDAVQNFEEALFGLQQERTIGSGHGSTPSMCFTVRFPATSVDHCSQYVRRSFV
jgi:hypothetical protein